MENKDSFYPVTHQQSIRFCKALAQLDSEGRLGQEASEKLSQLRKPMALLWNSLAQMAAAGISGAFSASVRRDAPGYVFLSQGKLSFAVPFYLIDAFPTGEIISEIENLPTKIRISEGSFVCLSGSGCSLGKNIPIGDLDFCEYISGVDERLAENIWHATKIEAEDLACFQVFLGGRKCWRRPWAAELKEPPEGFFKKIAKTLQNSKNRKVDYVAYVENLGVLEVTNKIISVNYAYSEVGEARSSFSMQEVPFVSSSWVPRNLSDPLEVGRYVTWLITEIKKYIVQSEDVPRFSVKALRRALSLARILFAKDEATDLYRLLSDADGARLAALYDRCNLFKTLKAGDSDLYAAYKKRLMSSIGLLRDNADGECGSFEELTKVEAAALNDYAIEVRSLLPGMVVKLENMINFS